jgi:hypothetical protein
MKYIFPYWGISTLKIQSFPDLRFNFPKVKCRENGLSEKPGKGGIRKRSLERKWMASRSE